MCAWKGLLTDFSAGLGMELMASHVLGGAVYHRVTHRETKAYEDVFCLSCSCEEQHLGSVTVGESCGAVGNRPLCRMFHSK